MKCCPLFILSDRRVQMGEELEIWDCIQEMCAWWNNLTHGCAIVAISNKNLLQPLPMLSQIDKGVEK